MAKVSVILPIYNVEQYLEECLESVIHQSLKEIEIICVNDGSTDSSTEIMERYAAIDPRIIIISGPNGGYGKAMNKGLDRASGEYIGIVEPDDYVDLNMFEELYVLAKDHDLDFVKADFYRFTRDEDGKEHRKYELLDKTKCRYGQLLNPSMDPECIRFMLNTWTGIYRRSFLNEKNIRHNETPGASFQDNGFYFQTFAYAQRAMIVNKPYYCNRRDNPNSSVKSKEKVYCMSVEYDYIQELLKRNKEVWLRFRYMYWWKKYHNYLFTYGRIDESFRSEFLFRMRQEYKRAEQLGELDENCFTKNEWLNIQNLIHETDGYKDFLQSFRVVRWISSKMPNKVKSILLSMIGRFCCFVRKPRT